MKERRNTLPSLSALAAFEMVARLRGFARAAEVLNTSQPAVSRHVRNLEIRFGTQLFDRTNTPITLTEKGALLFAGVTQGLDTLQNAVQRLQQAENRVTLVCTHSVSHLLVMPRYDRIRKVLGRDVELRVMTAEYDLMQAAVETGADIVFGYSAPPPETDSVVVCKEDIKPVGTADIVAQAQKALSGQDTPPPLLNLQKENFGWMGWSDWKVAHPQWANWDASDDFDSYIYLLDAAAKGAGLALGWKTFVDSYLDRGDLVEMPVAWYSKNTSVYAKLTRFGQTNAMAKKCLSVLENIERL